MRDTAVISKLMEFNDKYPQVQADCAFYLNWIGDSFAFADVNFEIRFYKRLRINPNATIDYCLVGNYEYRLCKDMLSVESEGVSNIDKHNPILSNPYSVFTFYAESWLPDKSRYHLSPNKPTHTVYGTSEEIYDITLKQGDALCWWTEDKNSLLINFQELDKHTTKILEKKYAVLEKIAASRKYKPGWIYHKMREDVSEINQLWAAQGYYLPLENKARLFASSYRWKYFRREAEAEHQAWLETFY